LLKVEFPEEGGVLTYMEKYSYPFKGYPHFEFVEKIDFVKKVNRAFLSGIYHQLKNRKKLWFLTLLPGLWVIKDTVRAWIHTSYRFIERFRIKKERYCTFVREFYKAFDTSSDGIKQKDKELCFKIRDLLCMVLEFDNAYRFRAQDILAELDKEKLRKNAIKEFLRLISIMTSREKTQEIKDTWTLIRHWLSLYLRYDRSMTKIIKNTILEIDIEKVKLSIEDKVYCLPRQDYNFGFVLFPQERDKKIKEMAAIDMKYGNEIQKTREESTVAHQEEFKNGARKEKLKELDEKYDNSLKQIQERYNLAKGKILNPITN